MSIREAFQEELRQMSQVAACARYRRGRRRGCSLPSDSLSPAQLRRRNGPVRVFRGGVEVVTVAAVGEESKTDEGENNREKMNIADREGENA